jgi:hypothetical protein
VICTDIVGSRCGCGQLTVRLACPAGTVIVVLLAICFRLGALVARSFSTQRNSQTSLSAVRVTSEKPWASVATCLIHGLLLSPASWLASASRSVLNALLAFSAVSTLSV